MDDASRAGPVDRELDEGSESDTRRSLRDMGALLALPALWVDHEPLEIATGLLSVLFGVLRLDGAYARFNDASGGAPLESWRPSGPAMPVELSLALATDAAPGSGITTNALEGEDGVMRVARVPLALPWETGLVLVSARRSNFPTPAETHLLRVAVSQGAIAIHTARRLVREQVARTAAEVILLRQNELLRSLAENIEPSLVSISRRVHEVSLLVAEVDATHQTRPQRHASTGAAAERVHVALMPATPLPLTRRELEVLGLLAQGLSNKEIAGVMWLSDRTVERHITSLYRKIGVARRSEATAFALRHGVI